jgi:hypothetical protein
VYVHGGGTWPLPSKLAFVNPSRSSARVGLVKTFLEGGVVMQVSETYQKTFLQNHFLHHPPTKEELIWKRHLFAPAAVDESWDDDRVKG